MTLLEQVPWLTEKNTPDTIKLSFQLKMQPNGDKKTKTTTMKWDHKNINAKPSVTFDDTLFFNSLRSPDEEHQVEIALMAENLKHGFKSTFFNKGTVLGWCLVDLPTLVEERLGITWPDAFAPNEKQSQIEDEKRISTRFRLHFPTEEDAERIRNSKERRSSKQSKQF